MTMSAMLPPIVTVLLPPTTGPPRPKSPARAVPALRQPRPARARSGQRAHARPCHRSHCAQLAAASLRLSDRPDQQAGHHAGRLRQPALRGFGALGTGGKRPWRWSIKECSCSRCERLGQARGLPMILAWMWGSHAPWLSSARLSAIGGASRWPSTAGRGFSRSSPTQPQGRETVNRSALRLPLAGTGWGRLCH